MMELLCSKEIRLYSGAAAKTQDIYNSGIRKESFLTQKKGV